MKKKKLPMMIWMNHLIVLNTQRIDSVYHLSKIVDNTYAHVYSTIRIFERMKLLTRKKEGRRNIITLTAKGVKAASLAKELKGVMT